MASQASARGAAAAALRHTEVGAHERKHQSCEVLIHSFHGCKGAPPSITRAWQRRQAMKAGAIEFLTKPFGDDVLLSAIRNAIERSQSALGREAEIRALRDGYESLTPRERQVMALVASGLLNKQVGGELNISEITVKAHRGQVMRKMKADSLADLVTMAARLHLARAPGLNPPGPLGSLANKRHL